MVFIVICVMFEGGEEILGMVCVMVDLDDYIVEFGVIVCFDFKGLGLGYWFMNKMIQYLCVCGMQCLVGMVLCINCGMLEFVYMLGF